MERFSSNGKQSGYNRNYYTDPAATSSGSKRKNIKVVRFGDKNKSSSSIRGWKIKTPTKVGSKVSPDTESSTPPSNIWKKVKKGCSKMMLNLAGNGDAKLGDKTIPATEFDNRIVMEIYKSVGATS